MGDSIHKREAQDRADRLRVFREELESLRAEGVLRLTAEQEAAVDQHLACVLEDLRRRFDVDTTESQKQFSWGMRIASTLGGVALCAGVYLFFNRIWGLLTTPAQVTCLILAPLAGLGATHVAVARDRTFYYASLLSLVAFSCFVLNLNALSAIFHVTPSPHAFLAWGAFGISVAYTYGMRLPLLGGLVCLAVWGATVTASWSGDWAAAPERPETFLAPGLLLVAASFLPAGSWADFPPLYRLLGLTWLFTALAVLSELEGSSFLPLPGRQAVLLYQAAGFAATSLTLWQSVRRGWPAEVYVAAGYFLFFLYARFVHWWWDRMPHYLFFLLVGVISIGLLALFRRLRARVSPV
jgi:uncharacterized membrane protein